MNARDPEVLGFDQARERFLDLVADLRPDLHRYCARMVGSIADGEDIVQDTLARAYFALPEFETLPPLRAWLFRIAHNRALDHLRSYGQRMAEPLETVFDRATDAAPQPDEVLAREQATQAALSRFTHLPPAQRSAVILKDVLGDSLEEIAGLLELSVPAVKAALHRGRAGLRAQAAPSAPISTAAASPAMARYAALFNARDWDGVRAMLSADVRLDLVSRSRRVGREVGGYVDRYNQIPGWRLQPAWLEGREVLAVFRQPGDTVPGYFIELAIVDGQIAFIRDFRHVPYIAREAVFTLIS